MTILACLSAFVAFSAAEPVWPQGEEASTNAFFEFRTSFVAAQDASYVLRVTAGYDYRAELNGAFAAFGPVRSSVGTFRVDEWTLAAKPGPNELSILVAGYNCNTFYLPLQTPFLQAELLCNGKVVAATGEKGAFAAYTTGRVRKVPRHSFQRVFSEAYHLPFAAQGPLPLVAQKPKRYLPREWSRPTFAREPMAPLSRERTAYDAKAPVKTPRFIVGAENFIHFPVKDLTENPYFEMQRTKTVAREAQAATADGSYALKADEGVVFSATRIFGGFPGFRVHVDAPASVYLTFDEVLAEDGAVQFTRTGTGATLVWHFDRAGDYEVEAFEPYGFKYLRLLAKGGAATVSAPWIRTYESPDAERAAFRSSDKALEKIFEAARASYKANAVDCLTDCPNRERGGWMGDTFFTGRASQWLTGSAKNERLFLENFLQVDDYGASPRFRGLIPAVWPSDLMVHQCFIPTFNMWLILELDGLVARTGDVELAERYRGKVFGILNWLAKYIDDDGFLRHMPGWVFVEWSRANFLSYDVNYPSNMLYAEALDAVARLYQLPGYAEKAQALRERIRKASIKDDWYGDNAVLISAGAHFGLSGERTEVCQYYAFFTKTATPERDPVLYRRLVDEFGPDRVKAGRYKEIWPANFLFGTLLRMEMLSRAGKSRQMLAEIRDYFLYMAERTGTLWENNTTCASCCHGFSSIASEYLFRDVLGVRAIDRKAKTVTFDPPADLDLAWCEGDVPLSETEIARLGWKKADGKLEKSIVLPAGWKLKGQK